VQAIDSAFAGSEFAEEQSFTITRVLRPYMQPIPDLVLNEDAPGTQYQTFSGVHAGEGVPQSLFLLASSTNLSLLQSVNLNYSPFSSTGRVSLNVRPNATGTGIVSILLRSFTTNNQELLSTNTFRVIVNPVNDPPVPAVFSVRGMEDADLTLPPLGFDMDGDALSYILLSQPAFGTLLLGSPHTYRPISNFFGSDSFTFQVSDGQATSVVSRLTIIIDGLPDVAVTALSFQNTNGFSLHLQGEPWQNYVIEVSSNLVDWSEWETLKASPDGLLTMSDLASPLPARFYRARKQP
jgi:hypothetical protein